MLDIVIRIIGTFVITVLLMSVPAFALYALLYNLCTGLISLLVFLCIVEFTILYEYIFLNSKKKKTRGE